MMYSRHGQRRFFLSLLLLLLTVLPSMAIPVQAEWYVAGDVGANFADRLTGISGTGDLTGVAPRSPNFDLKNSVSYGAKLGYFREHSWLGIEGEVLQTTPHIKGLDEDPGIHLRVTTVGVNLLAPVSWTYAPALRRSWRGHGDCPSQ